MTDQEVIDTLKAGQLCLVQEDPDQVLMYADELEREYGILIDRQFVIGEGTLLWIQEAVDARLPVY